MELEGEEGRFKAKILRQPRYIDISKCTSCAECTKVCPVTLPNEYDEGLSCKKATFKQYAQAIPGAFRHSESGQGSPVAWRALAG
ncbi:MAG: 4Fe-4S dicluster domain-containing protein [Desulfobacterales bacterium]|nr:4Fe-4S dicluster domain-containing protein [Desulfobacterales bacterium]